jgi:serine/threonine protein kinase
LSDKTSGVTAKGTLAYMAPEIFAKNEYSKGSDVYAFGITMNEVISGDKPHKGQSYNEGYFFQQVVGHNLRPTMFINDSNPIAIRLMNLISNCWSDNPLNRPSFKSICHDLDNLMGDQFNASKSGYSISVVPPLPPSPTVPLDSLTNEQVIKLMVSLELPKYADVLQKKSLQENDPVSIKNLLSIIESNNEQEIINFFKVGDEFDAEMLINDIKELKMSGVNNKMIQ